MPQWLQEVAKTLSALPDEIASLETAYNNADGPITELMEKLKLREYEILQAVGAELDPVTNKPKFTNETMRNGETQRKLKADAAASEISEKLRVLRDERSTNQIQLHLLTNKFSAVKHKADLYASWMRFNA